MKEKRISEVTRFIMQNWEKCVRFTPEDSGTLLGLPHPYVVPSAGTAFQEMYYWDTYFTCQGLILSNQLKLAESCAENMAYLIQKYGFMPNGSRTWYLTRSQPPYFCMLVRDIYEETKDREWLARMYPVIRKEYDFWEKERKTPEGLNRYGSAPGGEQSGKEMCERMQKRIGESFSQKDYDSYADLEENMIAECESGWDFNPRFGQHAKHYAPVDLNSNLYLYETTLQHFAEILNNGEAELWRDRAWMRRELMKLYLWNGEYYQDYDFVQGKHSGFLSAAIFSPLWAGVADKQQAISIRRQLSLLEFDFGIATCENRECAGIYQWHYPNAWAPLQFLTAAGLDRYGFREDALRVAEKYVAAIDKIFAETGNLWEKYNVTNGSVQVTNEYEMPDMLGWTAGVYLWCKNYMERYEGSL